MTNRMQSMSGIALERPAGLFDQDLVDRERADLNRHGNDRGFDIEIVKTVSRIGELRGEWNALADQFGTPLLRQEWFSACAQSLCPPGRLHMFVLRCGGEIKAIAPLVLMKRFGVEHFEVLGARDLFEPAGFLYRDSASFEMIVEAILEYGKPLLLQRFPREPVPRALQEGISQNPSWFVLEHENTSPWIPITVSWKQYEMRMKSKIRSGLRRIRKRLEEQGSVCMELYTGESAELDRALEEAFRIEASGWKRKNGTAILANQRLKNFFLTYVRIVSPLGMPRIFLLTLEGKGVAMMLGMEHARRLWILKVGYDEHWSSFAPGIVLHHETIRWSFERGLQGFEFLGSAEPFIQSRWLPDLHRYRTFRVAPKTIIGVLWLVLEAARVALKRTSDYLLKIRT